jgi:hypothetical protein
MMFDYVFFQIMFQIKRKRGRPRKQFQEGEGKSGVNDNVSSTQYTIFDAIKVRNTVFFMVTSLVFV